MSNPAITARFGAAVRSRRFHLGLSQEELAERADLHRTYIAGIERGGRNVSLKNIAKLARALEVSAAELVSDLDRAALHGGDSRPASARPMEILLVEDNPDDAALTLDAFRKVRIANRVQLVTDGAEALEYLLGEGRHPAGRARHPLPAVILLDLNLPKVSGFEVLRRVKSDSRTRHIPVIVLTISDRTRDIAESKRLGADNYIVKPVDFYNFTQVTPKLRFQWALFKPPSGRG